MLEKFEKPLGFSETVGPRRGGPRTRWRGLREAGGRPASVPEGGLRQAPGGSPDPLHGLLRDDDQRERGGAASTRMEPLAREWLMDLQVLGRSPQTIRWYGQKMDSYLRNGGVQVVEELTAFEVKRYLADLQGRGLAPNTVERPHRSRRRPPDGRTGARMTAGERQFRLAVIAPHGRHDVCHLRQPS